MKTILKMSIVLAALAPSAFAGVTVKDNVGNCNLGGITNYMYSMLGSTSTHMIFPNNRRVTFTGSTSWALFEAIKGNTDVYVSVSACPPTTGNPSPSTSWYTWNP